MGNTLDTAIRLHLGGGESSSSTANIVDGKIIKYLSYDRTILLLWLPKSLAQQLRPNFLDELLIWEFGLFGQNAIFRTHCLEKV